MPLLMQSCGPVEVSHGKIRVRLHFLNLQDSQNASLAACNTMASLSFGYQNGALKSAFFLYWNYFMTFYRRIYTLPCKSSNFMANIFSFCLFFRLFNFWSINLSHHSCEDPYFFPPGDKDFQRDGGMPRQKEL